MPARSSKIKPGELVVVIHSGQGYRRHRPIKAIMAYKPDVWNGNIAMYSHADYCWVPVHGLALFIRKVPHNLEPLNLREYSHSSMLAEILIGEELLHVPLYCLKRPRKPYERKA